MVAAFFVINMKNTKNKLKIEYLSPKELRNAEYNPRSWTEQTTKNLQESMEKFDMVDPLIVNTAPNRKNIVIGGHFRLSIAKKLGYTEVPVVFVNIPDIENVKTPEI